MPQALHSLLFAKTPAGSGINNITAALPTSVLLQPSTMFPWTLGRLFRSHHSLLLESLALCPADWRAVCVPQIRAIPFSAVAESAPRGVPELHGFEAPFQSSRHLSPLTVDNAT